MRYSCYREGKEGVREGENKVGFELWRMKGLQE